MVRTYVCSSHVVPLIPTWSITKLPSKLSCAWRLIGKFRSKSDSLDGLSAPMKANHDRHRSHLAASKSTRRDEMLLKMAQQSTSLNGGRGSLPFHITEQHMQLSEILGMNKKLDGHSSDEMIDGEKPMTWTNEDAKFCSLTVDVDMIGMEPENSLLYTETLGHHYLFFTNHTKLSMSARCPTVVKNKRVVYTKVHSGPSDITAVKVPSVCDIHTKVFKVKGRMKRVEERVNEKPKSAPEEELNIDRKHHEETRRLMTFNFIPLKNILNRKPVVSLPPKLEKRLEFSPMHATKEMFEKQQKAMEKIEKMPSWWEYQMSYISSWSLFGILGVIVVILIVIVSIRCMSR